jgi:A/G-specific adenine glycosylase
MNVDSIHKYLFEWWRKEGRILPWREKESLSSALMSSAENASAFVLRERSFTTYFAADQTRDPYRVVVAEMMLQQTQVDRVFPKYQVWMEKWPSIENLAQASLSEVLIFWQGLGYNRRARFLWLLAQKITEKYSGKWPRTEEDLLLLPGIGKYTARAILSFAFGRQVGVVDTNVKRILDRVFLSANPDVENKKKEKEYFLFADQILPKGQADPWNQALMDFGALICTAKSPKCPICPLNKICQANLDAINKGFPFYAEYLQHKNRQQKLTAIYKGGQVYKKKVRFEDTNRYFRGRIMDELRVGVFLQLELQQTLVEKYGLTDENRFQKLLADLQAEGLIRIEDQTVSLG